MKRSLCIAMRRALAVAFCLIAVDFAVADEGASKREKDLAQCISLCADDHICINNCNQALGEGVEEGEEECD